MDETASYNDRVPKETRDKYEFCEVRNASGIIASISPKEWADILGVISGFQLTKEDIVTAGGNKSDVASRLDESFRKLGVRVVLTHEYY